MPFLSKNHICVEDLKIVIKLILAFMGVDDRLLFLATGGKSGLRRARWFVTQTRGNPRESATENRPPRKLRGKGEKVR